MKTKKMTRLSRIIVAIASLTLTATFFLPIWVIYLQAPQYPEGLNMQIWFDKLTGQVDIINGLNHYIGMQHINKSMFPEFGYMVYIVGAFILLGLLVAFVGKRKFLLSYLVLSFLLGIVAMYDYWQWGYQYGHKLDPHAAIQIPGFSYQPPMIGHKKLLNFDAYSYPETGAWIFMGVVAVLVLVWFFEFRRTRKMKTSIQSLNKKSITAAAAVMLVFVLSSCTAKPQPFQYGTDNCDDCKMTIMDQKFGGEIVTKKGRVFKFDDIHCLLHFLRSGQVKSTDIKETVFIDYNTPNKFLSSASAVFVTSDRLESPMNSNTSAFGNKAAADKKASEVQGKTSNWEELQKAL
jgi:copper chaperone NosL